MITDMTVDDFPASALARINQAHDEQRDHAFDCGRKFAEFVAEACNDAAREGGDTRLEICIRRAAVRHSRHIRWVRDNVGTD